MPSRSMRVCLYSYDKGPGKNLELLAEHLQQQGHEIRGFYFEFTNKEEVGFGNWLLGNDALVLGMSSKEPKYELMLTRLAKARKIPVLWVADTHMVFNRPAFVASMKSGVGPDSIAVLDEQEARMAREVGYPRVVVTGLPLWESMVEMKCDVEQLRKGLDLSHDEKIVLAVFGKDPNNNERIINDLVVALNEVSADDYDYLALLPRWHPGDPKHPTKDSSFYSSILENSLYHFVPTIGQTNEYGDTDSLVLASDVVFGSHATTLMAAVLHRRPAIDYLPDYVTDRLEKMTGSRIWPPAESGATLKVDDPAHLADAFHFALSYFGQKTQRRFQELYYPKPTPGLAVKKLAAEVDYLVENR